MEKQNKVQKGKEQENKPSLKDRFLSITIKNPIVDVLFLIVVIMFIWFSIKISLERKTFKKVNSELILEHKLQLDSIQKKNIEFASIIFSWSVRSEMMRSNMDNLNQLFNVFIKESGADLIQLIKAEDNVIVISSDKKFEGRKFDIPTTINYDSPSSISDSLKITVYTPIMGFNKKIGLLVVELTKNK